MTMLPLRHLLPALGLGFSLATAACGPLSAPERVSVPGVDPVSGEVAAVEVDLPGADLASVRGPAGMMLLGASLENGRVQGGSSPECALRRKASGALSARSARCASLLGHYASMERARGFLLSAGAESLLPAPVLSDLAGAEPGLRYLAASDAFTVADGPKGARVPSGLNLGAVVREMSRRQLRVLAEHHPDEAEGIALFLGAAAAGDPGYLALSEPSGDPTGERDLARPVPSSSSSVLAGALWAWADASCDLLAASRAALAAARALDRTAPAGPESVLSLVAAQLDGAERDQACAVFKARSRSAAAIPACP